MKDILTERQEEGRLAGQNLSQEERLRRHAHRLQAAQTAEEALEDAAEYAISADETPGGQQDLFVHAVHSVQLGAVEKEEPRRVMGRPAGMSDDEYRAKLAAEREENKADITDTYERDWKR